MKLGEIFSKITEKRLSRYGITYQPRMDEFFDILLSTDEIKPIHIKSILVLIDRRPRSLVAIAYAIRLAKALDTELLAITKELHDQLIKDEAKEYDVTLRLLETYPKHSSVEYVLKIIQENDVGIVILHNLHELVDEIRDRSPVPVLIIKIERFIRSLRP